VAQAAEFHLDGAPGCDRVGITRMEVLIPVTLGLYDVSGRRVRALFRGEATAGESDYEWDGRDDRGRPAAAGLYFARVQAAGEAPRTAALLRLR
jgi:flagellar hook assembly protein FlgD